MPVAAILLAVLTALPAPPAAPDAPAQGPAYVEITLPEPARRSGEPPAVRSVQVLSDRRTRDLLHHGFPARLHYRLELWSASGWLDDLRERVDWDVIVRFTPLDRRYTAAWIIGDQVTPLGTFAELREVEEVLARPFRAPIRAPTGRDRFYYALSLNVEMLSVNDLDELERWLRGELRPAVRGRRNPGTALTRGLRALIVGLLGSENRHYEARSRTFVPE